MRTWPLWIAGTVMAAVAVHILSVLLLPPAIMTVAMSGMADAGADREILHAAPATADSRTVVRPSPDLAYSACLFDLTEGPLLVTAQVPDTYWSISAYARNTDNFFVVNDTQIAGDRVELLIAREADAETGPTGVPVSFAPTDTGVVLMRMLIADADSYAANEAVRRTATCETLPRAN